ncbi:MAG: hypothetical protein J0I80_13020 [Sphingomonas sp.]|nr:hypothetical protein [Sphingomonas sp.]
MKKLLPAILGPILTYLIVIRFGWTGLLISLPFFFAVPMIFHWAMEKWRRKDSLK